MGLRLPNPLKLRIMNLARALGGGPANFSEKLKVARGKFREKSLNSLTSGGGGSAPRTPYSDGIFNYYYILVQIRIINSWNLWKVINFLFHMTQFDKFLEIFSTFGGGGGTPLYLFIL